MLRTRMAALSLAATGAAALALALAPGAAVAHGIGHHGFGHRGFWHHHHGHAITGVVQSVDTSANTAVVTLGGNRPFMHRAWDHGGNPGSTSGQEVTLDLSGASIFDAAAMRRHCQHPGSGAMPSSTTLSSVQPGDVVTAELAVGHATAHEDLASGTALPVRKLVDWGQPQAVAPSPQAGRSSKAHRFH